MLKVVKEIPEIKEAALFGRGLHLSVQSAQEAIPIVVKALTEQKIPYTSLNRIKPSLEDVFVSIIEALDDKKGSPEVIA